MSTITPPQAGTTANAPAGEKSNGGPKGKKGPKDPRIAALWRFGISISVFTTVGLLFLGFEYSYLQPLVALGTAYVLEVGFELLESWSCERPPCFKGKGARGFVEFMLPAHITALSIALLLYPGQRIVPIVFAVSVAIASKSILTVNIKGRKKHFMNPSNLGIIAALLVFPSVGVAMPYQFTENAAHSAFAYLLPLFVLTAGTMLNAKLTLKYPLILGWLGGFVLQAVVRDALFGWPFLAPLLPLTGLVFWLFTNYMITDPGTTPFKPRNQVVFGVTAAFVYGALVMAHVVFAIFICVAVTCALRGLVIVAVQCSEALGWRTRPASAGVSGAAREVAS
jgi:enediyne biosynthesis protein E5